MAVTAALVWVWELALEMEEWKDQSLVGILIILVIIIWSKSDTTFAEHAPNLIDFSFFKVIF